MNIDHVAREMVDVEPSIDLEARIRGRIPAERHDDRAAWWTWRVAAPLVAAAAIALAIVVRGPGSRVQGPTSSVQVHAPIASPLVEVRSSPVPQFSSSQVTSSTLRKPTSLLARIPASRLSDAELAWMERRMPALDPMNALQVDHLRVDSIQPEPLAITPLTMTPIGTDGAGIERRNDR